MYTLDELEVVEYFRQAYGDEGYPNLKILSRWIDTRGALWFFPYKKDEFAVPGIMLHAF